MFNSGKICPYCGKETEYIDSSYIYGKSYGMVYICKPCDAYVGVHRGTNIALGSLANEHLRNARKKAHYWFDPIFKTGLIHEIFKEEHTDLNDRKKAYLWLSKQLEIDTELCHIAMFNLEQCNEVIKICMPLIKQTT